MSVDDMKKAMESLVWEDREIDLAKAIEIIKEHHSDGQFTLLSNVQLPDKVELSPDDSVRIEFDPAISEIMIYLRNKYGQEKGMLINMKLVQELFFSHLDHIQ